MRVFTSFRHRGLFASLNALIPAAVLAQSCPDTGPPAAPLLQRKAETPDPATQKIELSGDTVSTDVAGWIEAQGNVQVSMGERKLTADSISYRADTQTIKATGTVKYRDEDVSISGTDADVNTLGGANFENASFELIARSARGSAEQVRVSPDGNLSLRSVSYTSCPEDRKDWELLLGGLDINQESRMATGRDVRLEFKGIPILYTPYISFPVGNQRKSGLLFPVVGSSSRGGTQLSVPWYWNIAPNYDATFTPAYYSERGAALGTEFRFLTRHSKGAASANYLPHDDALGKSRSLFQWVSMTDFSQSLRLDLDASDVSDTQWFEDFGQGRDVSSSVYLRRMLKLSYLNDGWLATLTTQNLQVIDSTLSRTDRPYTLLPQLAVHGERSRLPYGLDFRFNGTAGYYTRSDIDPAAGTESVTGGRIKLAPEIHMPLRTQGVYVEPAVGWRYLAYDLSEPAVTGGSERPSVAAPVLSVDTGLTFERYAGSGRQRLQTLEPRLLYLYVPYRDQSDLPVFDTTSPDLNLVQLFRNERYVGSDRIGDANQLSVGVTSRMFNASSGQQYLSATIGQAFYFATPKVRLPADTADTDAGRYSSDIIAELSLQAYKHWNIGMGVQWNPDERRSERGNAGIQYAPSHDRVVNLGYSYQHAADRRDALEQWSGSFAWPIGPTWSTYGKVVYSSVDDKIIDRFAGFQYRSCCWKVRLVAGRSVSTRTGESDTSIRLQLELTGLSSVGTGADTFLERSIPGYSVN